ncbi:MAG: exo 1,3/1,4-beta-D-glucan glucohydrolase, partial [Caulobacterales bacterium]|nr:exo 1,3/1,4-beta-D-glucan glucohydrolase [Caulobacterales bacterium]
AAVPLIWGTDAVHGHSNIVGATIFPHNIGLGAARDRELIRAIGAVTAREVQVTGMDWTFAPTLAVVRDDRWGRSYEGYSEDAEIVVDYAAAMVEGLQGGLRADDFLGSEQVIATAKHFVGDGGTADGVDQGDNQDSEEELRDLHAAGYPAAIQAGVQTVMASFSSWRGEKLHGHQGLLSDVLIDRMGFDGFVVGDWNGHGQVEGCANTSCPAALHAGVDMFMAPDSWKGLYETTLEQARSGEIDLARLDEAVSRILRVKLRYGAYERGRPSERPLAGKFALLGAPEHRAVAREAVRRSLVLLKNDGGVLPLDPRGRILIAGDGADSIMKQSGGWTLTWQGEGNSNADFPNGQSIYDGLHDAITAAGGEAVLSLDGRYDGRPDAAIVVFGEDPYAEFQGDRSHLKFEDERPLALLRRLQAEGVPVISVFLSGRPLFVNREINASNAFVAAWLPGTEGAGVADVLLRDAKGDIAHDFTGQLSFSWPRSPSQFRLNRGEEGYDPLFAYGYGLTYADAAELERLDESAADDCPPEAGAEFMRAGRARAPYKMALVSEGGDMAVQGPAAATPDGRLSIKSIDRRAQEDARELAWTGPAAFEIWGEPRDLTREANAQMVITFDYAVVAAPTAPVRAEMRCAEGCDAHLDLTETFRANAGAGWRRFELPLSDLDAGEHAMRAVIAPFVLASEGALTVQISDVRLAMADNPGECAPAPGYHFEYAPQ